MKVDYPSQRYLMECFNYERESGEVTWTVRPRSHFESDWSMNQSNSRNSGRKVSSKSECGYTVVKISGVTRQLHRVIWKIITGTYPEFIDHVNGIRADNRWLNLRDVGRLENAQNRGLSSNNSSGKTGVSYRKKTGTWVAYISVEGNRKWLIETKDYDEAVAARKQAEVEYYKEFRRVESE